MSSFGPDLDAVVKNWYARKIIKYKAELRAKYAIKILQAIFACKNFGALPRMLKPDQSGKHI